MTNVAPDLTDKVLGYRYFRVGDDTLRSVWAPDKAMDRGWTWHAMPRHQWTPGVNTAICRRLDKSFLGDHSAPHNACECGLYGMYTTKHAASSLLADRRKIPLVLGAILGWGIVEAQRTGFRAQYAEIVALDAEEQTAKGYGVPVYPRIDFERITQGFGRTIPHALRPNAELGGYWV